MRYKLSLRDKVGYSYSSKNISRKSLSKTSRKSDAQKVKNNKMTKEQFKEKWGSTMCFAWFVFEHGYKNEPVIRWI